MAGASSRNLMKRVCMLKPMEPEHHIIHLKDGKNIIGRSKETGIRDVKCSKQQIELNVNLDKAKIELLVLGVNPSGINGLMAMHNTKCELEHGDIIEIVYSRHPFEVIFKPSLRNDALEKMDTNSASGKANVAKDEKVVKSEMWDSVENGKLLIFTGSKVKGCAKIAGYDIDGTIIKTKSGNVFPKNIDDWEIIYPQVPGKLKLLTESGYKVCFFTNQAGISKGKVNVNDFKQKIKAILKKLDVPIQVFVSTGEGIFRKPLPGMWQALVEQCNDNVKIDLGQSFYVGDAAGRPESGSGSLKRKKDHSYVDRFFAANIGISFYTPEEHFLGKKTEQWTKPDLEPSKLHDRLPLLEPETSILKSHSSEIIIMVGLPGSGKSHFVEENLRYLGYEIVNADSLGSVSACLKCCENALKSAKSCVIDNTNVDVESRKKFIALAKQYNVPCRCFIMNVTLSHVKHNVAFRQLTDVNHSKINDMVMNTMKKRYAVPTLDEGFTEIVKVNIKPTFKDKDHERLYRMYLVEK